MGGNRLLTSLNSSVIIKSEYCDGGLAYFGT